MLSAPKSHTLKGRSANMVGAYLAREGEAPLCSLSSCTLKALRISCSAESSTALFLPLKSEQFSCWGHRLPGLDTCGDAQSCLGPALRALRLRGPRGSLPAGKRMVTALFGLTVNASDTCDSYKARGASCCTRALCEQQQGVVPVLRWDQAPRPPSRHHPTCTTSYSHTPGWTATLNTPISHDMLQLLTLK